MTMENQNHTEIVQLGTFTLDSQLFGVNILQMREIIRPLGITRVPHAPAFMEGVINLRGEVIPIVSLRARFGMPVRPFDRETCIINMEIDKTAVGFVVDSIGHVRRVPATAIEEPPVVASSADAAYVAGLIRTDDGLLIALNVEKLVSIEALKDFMRD